jgi:hypothetical protein
LPPRLVPALPPLPGPFASPFEQETTTKLLSSTTDSPRRLMCMPQQGPRTTILIPSLSRGILGQRITASNTVPLVSLTR